MSGDRRNAGVRRRIRRAVTRVRHWFRANAEARSSCAAADGEAYYVPCYYVE